MGRRRWFRSELLAVAVALGVNSGCTVGGPDPALDTDVVPTVGAATTPAPPDDIPEPEGVRDQVVYERLLADGFSAAEANCLARLLSLDAMVSSSPDELIDIYAECTVGPERLIELGNR